MCQGFVMCHCVQSHMKTQATLSVTASNNFFPVHTPLKVLYNANDSRQPPLAVQTVIIMVSVFLRFHQMFFENGRIRV